MSSSVPNDVNWWDGSSKRTADRTRAWDGSSFVDGIFRVWDGTQFWLLHPTSLAAPSSLSTSVVSGSRIDLSWAARPASEPCTSVRVERATSSGGPFTEIASLGKDVVSYSATGLNPGTTYYFRVRYAIDLEPFYGSYSTQVSATTELAPVTQAPLLTVTDDPGDDTSLDISWTTVPEATEYRLQRESTLFPGIFSTIFTGPGTSYTDDLGASGLTRTYRVRGQNTDSSGPYSSEQSATTQAHVPGAPTSVVASADSNSVLVTWSQGTPANEDNYIVQRSVNGGSYSTVATPTATSYDDTSVVDGNTYQYRVAATNSAGTSSYTTSNSEQWCAPVSTPSISSVSTTGVSDPETQLRIVYSATSGYDILIEYKQSTSGTWLTNQGPDANGSPFILTGLAGGVTYDVRIRERNACGDLSGYSTTVQGTTDGTGISTAPSLIAAPVDYNDSEIELTIGSVPNATNYDVEWAQSVSQPGSGTIESGVGTSGTWTHTGRPADTSHWYRARGTNIDGDGPWSGWQQAYTHIMNPAITGNAQSGDGVDYTVDHDNTDSNSRDEQFEWQWRSATTSGGLSSASWSSSTTETGGTTTFFAEDTSRSSTYWIQVRVRYTSETTWVTSGNFEVVIFS